MKQLDTQDIKISELIQARRRVAGRNENIEDPDMDGPLSEEKKTENAVHLSKRLILYFILGASAALLFSYVANLVLPNGKRWLSSDDMDSIKIFVTSISSSVITALAVGHFFKK